MPSNDLSARLVRDIPHGKTGNTSYSVQTPALEKEDRDIDDKARP
jgi:hypothetical protein